MIDDSIERFMSNMKMDSSHTECFGLIDLQLVHFYKYDWDDILRLVLFEEKLYEIRIFHALERFFHTCGISKFTFYKSFQPNRKLFRPFFMTTIENDIFHLKFHSKIVK